MNINKFSDGIVWVIAMGYLISGVICVKHDMLPHLILQGLFMAHMMLPYSL